MTHSTIALKTTLVILSILLLASISSTFGQSNSTGRISKTVSSVGPLDTIYLSGLSGTSIIVKDGNGAEYFRASAKPVMPVIVGGALGTHTVYSISADGKQKQVLEFLVDAKTNIDDGGYYNNMFDMFYKTMCAYAPDGEESITWNGTTYHYFVHWMLDDCHTMKGMKYFRGRGTEFIDLMRKAQREDGMIWSFIHVNQDTDYYLTRDKFTGYTKKIGDQYFTRQPVENHPEYIYVNTIYQCWKANGDHSWMKTNLNSAKKALDYAMNDPARWSKRFELLKRVYTIDSWDFAVDDEYMPDLGMTNSMIIDPVKSKFGIFFGDNTGYISACDELAEMYEKAGDAANAQLFRQRAKAIGDRLTKLAWNGHFYTHFIDEDSTVVRKLGVDEKSQFAQSNAYSLNRDISHEQKKAIIESYMHLKSHLPVGSPGEWYSIYPPFQKGFEIHNGIWEYMNGGVGGHVAGELAKGCYAEGYEKYGTDVLNRLFELGKKYDNKIWFAYTGSIPPPPPPPVYKKIDLKPYANMDSWDRSGGNKKHWMLAKRNGDDFRSMPTGDQVFANIPFAIIDPAANNRNAVIAVSRQKDFPISVEIPINDSAGSIYFLHTSSKPSSENLSGTVVFEFADGTQKVQYMLMGKQLMYWWFSKLQTDYSGIAWYGKNQVSEGIGLSWCAINNPQPGKLISKIILQAPADTGIYTVFAITLASKPHYVPQKAVSYGGPDNWAGSTAMAAMIEGLAGVRDNGFAFDAPLIAPQWNTTKSDSVHVTVRYAASKGYVSYFYKQDRNKKVIGIDLAGSAKKMNLHIPVPDGGKIKTITASGKSVPFKTSTIEQSKYADFVVEGNAVHHIEILY